MRVYDYAMRTSVSTEHEKEVQTITAQAVVVDAENVCRWVRRFLGEMTASEQASLYRRAIPPFPVTMIEYREQMPYTCGYVVERCEDDAGSRLDGALWVRHDGDVDAELLPYVARMRVDEGGIVEDLTASCLATNDADETRLALQLDEIKFGAVLSAIVFRFMHAKNVRQVERTAARQERRKAEREGKPPLVTYRTLEIGPITHALETEGRIGEVGLARAMHICRGHFADYTKGAGLFGRHKVEVFVPAHVRGSAKHGVVVKDYDVAPPSEPTDV